MRTTSSPFANISTNGSEPRTVNSLAILNDSSFAAVSDDIGNRWMFFQDTNRQIRQSIYELPSNGGSTSSWRFPEDPLATNAFAPTPLSAVSYNNSEASLKHAIETGSSA